MEYMYLYSFTVYIYIYDYYEVHAETCVTYTYYYIVFRFNNLILMLFLLFGFVRIFLHNSVKHHLNTDQKQTSIVTVTGPIVSQEGARKVIGLAGEGVPNTTHVMLHVDD